MPLDVLPTLVIPDDHWEAVGEGDDIRARLLAQVVVCGTMMHDESFQADPESDPQCPVADAISEEAWDRLANGLDSDGRFMTTSIAGREYIVVISPHGD
jgi:hypothetical protein